MSDKIARSDVEAVLAENGYKAGEPNDDREKDASHVWYHHDGTKFVMLSPGGADDDACVFGCANAEGGVQEAGVSLSYRQLIAVASGAATADQVQTLGFSIPEGVLGRLAPQQQSQASAALPEAALPEDKA